MRTNGVVGVDVLSDPCDHLLWCLVLLDVEVVVFQTAEEPLGPYIIQCLSFAVHGDLNIAGVQELKVGGTGEVAPLIRVHDLRLSLAQGTPKAAQDKLLLEAIADLIVDDPAAEPVDDDEQVQEAFLEGNIGDVDPPYLVDSLDNQIPQKVGPDVLRVVSSGEVRARIQGLDVHQAHQAPNPLTVDVVAGIAQIVGYLAVTPGRVVQMDLVDDRHEGKILF